MLLAQVTLLAGSRQEPKRIAELLFNLVFCLPSDRFHVPFVAHDFGGASKFWNSPEILPTSWSFLQADPSTLGTIPSVKAFRAVADLFPVPTEPS
jgi:hypothetical protein